MEIMTLKDIEKNLKIVLDFVERNNKEDREYDVAEAASLLSVLIY